MTTPPPSPYPTFRGPDRNEADDIREPHERPTHSAWGDFGVKGVDV